jgi:hypothetical protein
MFIDKAEFKEMVAQAVYAGVRQALEHVQAGVPAGKIVPTEQPKAEEPKPEPAVEDVVKEVVTEEPKPAKKKTTRKKAAPKKVEPEVDFDDEDDAPLAEEKVEEKEDDPVSEEDMTAEEFISAVKSASKGDLIRSKKLLKSLIKVSKFSECPASRRTEFVEALKNA